MTKRLTADEIITMTDSEMRNSVGYWGGKLEEMRRKNLQYFLGLAKGDLAPPEIEGRSSVVDTTVRNTVLGMQGPLIKTFCGTENVVEFSATTEADEDKAKQATDYLNYILRKKNPGYSIISTWITDALIEKVGIIKVWWDDAPIETVEEYRGQTDVQLALLLDDDEVAPTEQSSYEDPDAIKQKADAIKQMEAKLAQMTQAAREPQPAPQPGQPPQPNQSMQQLQQATAMYKQFKATPVPKLYDVTVKRTKTGGKLCIENVPPEEFLISKKARDIPTAPFVGHRLRRTISKLRAMGYKNIDAIGSDDTPADMNPEGIERNTFDSDQLYTTGADQTVDPEQREVWITECYLQADYDGNGRTSWRKIVRGGAKILEDEECDGPPFVSLCPTPLPHRFFGLCPADLAMEPQRVQTALLRAQLDNVYLQVNGRYFAVENQVNLDDLLTSRPGGVVRVKQPNAVGRLDQGAADSGHAMELLQWFENFTEDATGWTRQSTGGDGLQLDQTATQVNITTNRADARIEIISRQFAETGFTELFKLMLKLVCQYQNKSDTVKLGNKWQDIDPREWTNQFDLTINVGLGTGNKDQLVQHLMALGQKQGEGLQIGVATPKNIYNANAKLAEALGFKNAELFFTDPDGPPDPKAPPKPPAPPDPHIVAAQMKTQADQQTAQMHAQAQQQTDQARLQLDHQKHVDTMQADASRAQLDAQVAISAQRAQAEQAQAQIEQEGQRDMQKLQMELAVKERLADKDREFEAWKIKTQQETAIIVAQIAAGQQINSALIAAEAAADQGAANAN